MYKIEILDTIKKIIAIFYRLGFWDSKNTHRQRRQLFHFIYFVSVLLTIAVGAFTTDDKDDSIFLTVISIIFLVHAFRLSYIISNKNEILTLIYQTSAQQTNDYNQFIEINDKLKYFSKFSSFLVLMCTVGLGFIAVLPFISSTNVLVFNYGLPSYLKNSKIIFCITHVYVVFGFVYALIMCLVTVIVWYIMINCAIQYEILGNTLRHIGVIDTRTDKRKVTKAEQQKLIFRHIIEAIETHRKINKLVDQLTKSFSKLFFLQIATSSLSICGSTYSLAFSSHRNFIQNAIYSMMIIYNLFDIFAVMYLGNQIELSSDRMSYCWFESIWTEQTQSFKKYIIIMTEALRRPKQVVVGKLYPLNLKTFTSIVKGAYSMFNILKNLSVPSD